MLKDEKDSVPNTNHPEKTERRSRLLVDREVQSALIRRIIIHWFLFVFVTFGFVGFLQACIEHPSNSLGDLLSYVIARNALGFAAGLALIPVFVLDTIKATNRFAGPIARLRTMLRALAEGKDEVSMALRNGDYWKEMAQEFNAAVGNLRARKPAGS
jgi:hypothetical protein